MCEMMKNPQSREEASRIIEQSFDESRILSPTPKPNEKTDESQEGNILEMLETKVQT